MSQLNKLYDILDNTKLEFTNDGRTLSMQVKHQTERNFNFLIAMPSGISVFYNVRIASVSLPEINSRGTDELSIYLRGDHSSKDNHNATTTYYVDDVINVLHWLNDCRKTRKKITILEHEGVR